MRLLPYLVVVLLCSACGAEREPAPGAAPPASPAAGPAEAPADGQSPDSLGGERLVERYLGLIHPPLPTEVVKRGGALAPAPGEAAHAASFAFEKVSVGATHMLWLSALERRNAAGEAVWRLVDAVAVPGADAAERLLIAGCRAAEHTVAAVVAASDAARRAEVRRAWRVAPDAERLVAVEPADVTCTNEALRAP